MDRRVPPHPGFPPQGGKGLDAPRTTEAALNAPLPRAGEGPGARALRPDLGRRPPAVLCDFDDTVAVQNVAEVLLERFGDGTWRELREAFRRREVTLKEYQEEAFRRLSVTRQAMQQAVREVCCARPGFVALWRHCQERGYPLAIVTHGLDFYVEALLEREGLPEVPYYAVATTFDGAGIRYLYKHTQVGCTAWGNCKCAVLERYRRQGHRVVFVGDGRSDTCPAIRADVVFARSSLLRFCQEQGLPHHPFEDFHGVLAVLREWEQGPTPCPLP